MTPIVWIKVVGFNANERHSLNTLFRLSVRQTPAYCLWTRNAPVSPQVILVDMESHEGVIELASPSFNPDLKLICVGSGSNSKAWRIFSRPVDWSAVVTALDALYGAQRLPVETTGFGGLEDDILPPGLRSTLVVGLLPDQRMYLRARLALAGFGDVDEADNSDAATACFAQRHYDVVIVSLETDGSDPWNLVQMIKSLPNGTPSVILVTENPSPSVDQRAEHEGCVGVLEIPFLPPQVIGLLQKM